MATETDHPVEGSINRCRRGLTRVKVWNKEHIGARGGPHGIDVETVSGKRGGKDTAVDEELGGLIGVLGNLAADGTRISRTVPIEVEGDEDFHAVIGGRLVSEVELRVGIAVHANVEGKGIDACVFGAAHVIVVVGDRVPFTNDTNLVLVSASESGTRESVMANHEMAEHQSIGR